MKRLLFAALCVLFFPFAALADAPKATYSIDEQAKILTAATLAGALAYCDDHSIYKNRTGKTLYYRIAAHMKPHVESEDTAEGMISRSGAEFFGFARTQGRAALITTDEQSTKFYPSELIEMRSDAECKKVEKLAFKTMSKGALFDNDAPIPGEQPA